MLSINISELIWGIINFFLLYFLLRRFLFTPLMDFMDKRNERINEGLEVQRQAQAAREQTENNIRAAKEEELTRTRQLLAGAEEENSRRLTERVEQARQEAGAKQKLFDDGIEQLRQEKCGEFAAHSGELAALLADKLLQE